jgi:DNA-binding CsgD family transcriptional regulator
MHDGAAPSRERVGISALSPREQEVLELTATGMTNDEVAAGLSISVHAVKFHLAAIYRKLRVSNRTEATVLYLRHALPGGALTQADGD